MPPSFIDHKKLDMLVELRKKIQDKQLKKNIDLIWKQWSEILYKKEQQEANHSYINPQPSPSVEEVTLSSPPSVMSVASPVTLSATSSPNTSLSSVYSPPTPSDISLPQTPTTPDGDKLIGDPVIIPVFDTDPDGKTFKWGEFKYGKKQSGKVGNNPKA